MRSCLPLLFLAPAALVAAAQPELTPPAAAELDALEADFRTYLHKLQAADAPEWAHSFVPEIEECLALMERYRRGASPDATTGPTGGGDSPRFEHGLTMLHLACLGQKPELVRALLAAGADPTRRSLCPLFSNGATDCLSMALDGGLPGTAEAGAASLITLVDLLVEAGADVRGEVGARALETCAWRDSAEKEEVFLHLLELGADPQRAAARWLSMPPTAAGRARSPACCPGARSISRLTASLCWGGWWMTCVPAGGTAPDSRGASPAWPCCCAGGRSCTAPTRRATRWPP